MKQKLQDKLVKRFPELFADYGKDPQESCMSFGIAIGDGWYRLFEMLCEELDSVRKEELPELKFEQVKEKFGRLRVYVGGMTKRGAADWVYEINNRYEVASGFTCEYCGKLGRIGGSGWIKCLCESCRNPNWLRRLWSKVSNFVLWKLRVGRYLRKG